jgi:hypothetical protein
MIRSTLMAVAVLMFVGPMAQAATCKEQLADVDKLMNSAIDAKKKQDATKYVEQAKAALTKEDENGCIVHAQNARRTLLGD